MASDETYTKSRDTELILPPGVFAFVLDETKGRVNTLCGPIKTSLSNTDRLVTYNPDTKRFVPATQQQAIQTNVIVPKGQYVILENPSNNNQQPEAGKLEDLPVNTLKMGQIENIPGPVSFALWPGQKATIIRGHHLRSNQYLLGRVYDDEAAKSNWDKSVVKEVTSAETEGSLNINKEGLITGQLLVIKGTEVAFYIPPTGIEVLMDEDGKYVRDAVTLERLEYSILLDEDGNKQYVRGPQVVFPEPTQTFVTSSQGKDNKRKFRAYELQPTNGIHIKVIADYIDEETGIAHKAGDELFLTGNEKAIYFPQPEHSVVRYGEDKHFATAIPAGEGRYVLDRQNGNIDLVKGPNMFLPNPINQVLVRRILSESECELYFPGNEEVANVNRQLMGESQSRTKSGIPIIPSEQNLAGGGAPNLRMSAQPGAGGSTFDSMAESAATPYVADSFQRSQKHTGPRSITLHSKYQGAVRIEVFSGYAVQVVNSKGQRRVVVGPQIVLLEYDEKLERLSLSKGRPKNPDVKLNTSYLKHTSNPVSDRLILTTSELVNVEAHVKYLVRFEEKDKDKWFAIDNYVQYMVDHLRSLISNAVRNIGVQEFYQKSADILRDIVLGAKVEGKRPLKHFAENGMTVYDLELIEISVVDEEISELLSDSRHESLSDAIQLETLSQKLLLTRGTEDNKRQILLENDATEKLQADLVLAKIQREGERAMTSIREQSEAEAARKAAMASGAEADKAIGALRREVIQKDRELEAFFQEAELERKLKLLIEEARASETKMKSVQPGLVEALTASANAGILEKVAPSMAALAFVNGSDLDATLGTMLKGTGAESVLENLKKLSTSRSK